MENLIIKKFSSLNEFRRFLEETPENKVFEGRTLSSKIKSATRESFSGTSSYEEALDLMTYGWHQEAEILTKALKNKKVNTHERKKMEYNIVGFQASVPRYLQGIPTNMYNQKSVKQKQKIISLVKNCSYPARVEADDIRKMNINMLHLLKTLESNGYKVNLDYLEAASGSKQTLAIRIRLKTANERLNISKLAFPLCHPSMLRRLILRFTEVTPELTDYSFLGGYGKPLEGERVYLKSNDLKPNEYYIPAVINEKFIEEFLKNF